MKKILSFIMLAAVVASTMLGTSAAVKGDVLEVAHGTAVIDGKLDEAYKKSSKIDSFVYKTYNEVLAAGGYAPGTEPTFVSYVLFDGKYMQVFTEVFDKTPVTPANVTKFNHTTDSIEYYWILKDWDKGVSYNDKGSLGSGQFRLHSKAVCENDDTLVAHLAETGGLNLELTLGTVKEEVARVMTGTGYIIEYKFEVPAELLPLFTPGYEFGFGMQLNDDADDNNTRDGLVWNENTYGDERGKSGTFKYLGVEAATTTAATTTAATTTAATTTAATTTKAPTTSPSTSDMSVYAIAGMVAMAAVVVIMRKKQTA